MKVRCVFFLPLVAAACRATGSGMAATRGTCKHGARSHDVNPGGSANKVDCVMLCFSFSQASIVLRVLRAGCSEMAAGWGGIT